MNFIYRSCFANFTDSFYFVIDMFLNQEYFKRGTLTWAERFFVGRSFYHGLQYINPQKSYAPLYIHLRIELNYIAME